jgi:hypothetical protein
LLLLTHTRLAAAGKACLIEVDAGSREETPQNKKLEPGSDSIMTGRLTALFSSNCA